MSVLVIYASHYGATKEIAEHIGESLRCHGTDVEVRSAESDDAHDDLASYDAFVIGSAIHVGRWLRPAVDYVREHGDALRARPVWLFSSGPMGEKHFHEPQPDPAEIAELRGTLDVRDHVVFGGAFDPKTAERANIGRVERTLVTRFLPVGDFRDWSQIEAWADGIADALAPVPVSA